ncbi:hypothetical protein H4R19_001964 [Coemansia spiralis]|nr:hypothetical protein H4R19_001964 [Coemansia spiralis]
MDEGEDEPPPAHSADPVGDGARLPAFPDMPEIVALGEDTGGGGRGRPGGSTRRVNERWSAAELARLERVVEANRTRSGKQIDWEAVEESFPHRTRQACAQVLTRLRAGFVGMSDGAPPRRFSPDERAALLAAVRNHGEHCWRDVAEDMRRATGITRSATVYSRYWSFSLCPKARAAPEWSPDMSKRLRSAAAAHGKDPVFLTYRFFPSYTPAMIARMLGRMDTKHADLDPRRGVCTPKSSAP